MQHCEYRDIFGTPGEGAHFHVGGIAIVDLLLTALAAVIIGRSVLGFIIAFALLMIIGTAMHWYFCVDTALTRALGL